MDLRRLGFFAEQGYAVVSPDYRLAPEHPFPAQFDDAEACFEFLFTSSAINFDSSKIGFFGSSAGAWIATGLAIRLLHKKAARQPKVVVLDRLVFYPPPYLVPFPFFLRHIGPILVSWGTTE